MDRKVRQRDLQPVRSRQPDDRHQRERSHGLPDVARRDQVPSRRQPPGDRHPRVDPVQPGPSRQCRGGPGRRRGRAADEPGDDPLSRRGCHGRFSRDRVPRRQARRPSGRGDAGPGAGQLDLRRLGRRLREGPEQGRGTHVRLFARSVRARRHAGGPGQRGSDRPRLRDPCLGGATVLHAVECRL